MKVLFFAVALFLSAGAGAAGGGPRSCRADSELVRFVGRAAGDAAGSLSFDWSGSHFSFRFDGTACSMRASDTGCNYYNVFVDGKFYGTVTVEGGASVIPLVGKLRRGPHTVTVQKRTEAEQGRTTLYAIETDGRLLAPPPAPGRLIEFIGDSHTCGYGTEGLSPREPFTPRTENCDLAWACITARYFDADYVLIAHSGRGIVRNWGDPKAASEITMTDRMVRTFDEVADSRWDFQGYKPDIVVIKLGTNDLSADIVPSERVFGKAFRRMCGNLREKYGDVPILYVVPQGAGPFYDFARTIIKGLNDKNLHCILQFDEIHDMDADLGAGYHPNYRGHRKIAAAVIPYIATITGWEMPLRAIE